MTVTCLAFSGVIAEDGLDTQGLSVGPTAPIAGAWSWGRSELTARVPCRPDLRSRRTQRRSVT